jgi:hypothetical protein
MTTSGCEEKTVEEYIAAVEEHCLAKFGKLLGAFIDAPLELWFTAGVPAEAAAVMVNEGGLHPVSDDCRNRVYELTDVFSRALTERREKAGEAQVIEYLAQAAVLAFLAALLRSKLDPRGLGPEWVAELHKEMIVTLAVGDADTAASN